MLDELQRNIGAMSLDAPGSKSINSPKAFEEDLKQEMEAVKRRYEEERRAPPYKVAAPPHVALIEAQRRERLTLVERDRTAGLQQMRTYAGVPKTFSIAALNELEKGEGGSAMRWLRSEADEHSCSISEGYGGQQDPQGLSHVSPARTAR